MSKMREGKGGRGGGLQHGPCAGGESFGRALTECDEGRTFERAVCVGPGAAAVAGVRFQDPGPPPRGDDVARPGPDGVLLGVIDPRRNAVKVRPHGRGQARRGGRQRRKEVMSRFVDLRGMRVNGSEEVLPSTSTEGGGGESSVRA